MTVVVKGVACVLVHTPGLVCHGSKPARELARAGAESPLLKTMRAHLRPYAQAVAYPPNQAFIGNLRPEALFDIPRPWWCADPSATQRPATDLIEGSSPGPSHASSSGPFGEILAEEAF